MTDFEYDVKEKKRIARNAFNKKGGSKSKSCSLPSDHMTDAQWKKRNGKVMSYDLKQPLNWVQFTTMPAEIQEEYLRRLSDRYHVTIRCLADLFGMSWDTVSRYLKVHHPWLKFKRGNAMSDEDKAGFAEFLCGSDPYSPAVLPSDPGPSGKPEKLKEQKPEKTAPVDTEQVPPYDKKTERPGFQMRRLTAEFETPYEPGAVNNMILAMMPAGLAGSDVRIRIDIEIM